MKIVEHRFNISRNPYEARIAVGDSFALLSLDGETRRLTNSQVYITAKWRSRLGAAWLPTGVNDTWATPLSQLEPTGCSSNGT